MLYIFWHGMPKTRGNKWTWELKWNTRYHICHLTEVKVARLDPLSFTYMITLLNKLDEFSNIFTWVAMVAPKVFYTSKIPTRMWTRSHSSLIKLNTMAKVPCPTWNIHKSKEVQLLKGEIVTPNHYHPLEGKIEGTRSTSYYSTKKNYPH